MTTSNATTHATTGVLEQDLVITRRFAAPRQRVFAAWTEPELARAWWGPRDYPLTHLEMDARPGGAWRARLTSVETGEHLWQSGVIREIHAPDRLVYTFAWDGEEGSPGRETLVTVSFEEDGDGTLMTFRQSPFDTVENREGHRGGWSSTFDRLDDLLGTQTI
jgi:uncharacterized protein YndB with AHSA1/START domain